MKKKDITRVLQYGFLKKYDINYFRNRGASEKKTLDFC